MTVYVSTGGYGNVPAHISAGRLADAGVRAIELSGGRYAPDLIQRLTELLDRVSFQVHNYFPPPEEPFVLNIGSLDDAIAMRS